MAREITRESIFDAADIEAVGVAMFGDVWKSPLARAMLVDRQRIDHYTAHGVRGTQALALVGVLSSAIVTMRTAEDERRRDYDTAEAEIKALHARLTDRLVG